ncbi:DUF1127 domain-containing protein [Roseibium litorale]|uniref:DUF1127 domain-containing protein n=1 Tax=Roseibium litorale TaxID=2803841 RepID=A0ABR9CRN2_9HYPH|nr:DUF1127 domain-containing protein [Roseibium litorale]MBD8892916.1 DUF1127 domain-containing protein [Roseibium litorale]
MTTPATKSQTATAWAVFARVFKLLKNRRQVNRLSHLTDEQLMDIGLTRSEVRSALRQPLSSDPSVVLSQAASIRHLSTVTRPQSAVLLAYEAPRSAGGQRPAKEGHLAA